MTRDPAYNSLFRALDQQSREAFLKIAHDVTHKKRRRPKKLTSQEQVAKHRDDLHWTTKPPKPDKYVDEAMVFLDSEDTIEHHVFYRPEGYDLAFFTNWIWFRGYIDPEAALVFGVRSQFVMNIHLARLPLMFVVRKVMRSINAGFKIVGSNPDVQHLCTDTFDPQRWTSYSRSRLENGLYGHFQAGTLLPAAKMFQVICGNPTIPLKTDLLCVPMLPRDLYVAHGSYINSWGVLDNAEIVPLLPVSEDEADRRSDSDPGSN